MFCVAAAAGCIGDKKPPQGNPSENPPGGGTNESQGGNGSSGNPPPGNQSGNGSGGQSEYAVKTYYPNTKYEDHGSSLRYGEVNFDIRHDFDAISPASMHFSIRLPDDAAEVTHYPDSVETKDGFEYLQSTSGGDAWFEKSGTGRAVLYEDSGGSFANESFGWLGSRWCQGKLYINTESETIKNAALEIRAESSSPYEAAKNIAVWMGEQEISYGSDNPSEERKTPVEVLDSGKGECIEFSMLYVSMCRAAGVPARIVWGDGYFSKNFTGHVWAEFYDNEKWISVDMTKMITEHAGPAQSSLGPISDFFGFFDAGDVPLWTEDNSENSIQRLYNDTYHFNIWYNPQSGGPTQTISGQLSTQKRATLIIYNTGRRELIFQSAPT
jgi:hypothetical protein